MRLRRLKVVVADDHGLMIEAVGIALARSEFEIVGVAESGSQVLPVVQQTEPDLVVLDLRMPGMDGLTCIRLLRERMPSVRIAVLSAVDSEQTAQEALSLGACAFISKRIDPDELPHALLAAFEETVPEPMGLIHDGDIPAVREAGLTERELEILRALAEGAGQQPDCEAALARGADRQVPPHQHLPQARRRQQDRGRSLGIPKRPARSVARGHRGRVALSHVSGPTGSEGLAPSGPSPVAGGCERR